MKIEEKLKALLVILAIILVSFASFGGIYIQKAKSMENIVPSYKLGMDLAGGRIVELEPDKTEKTTISDEDENEDIEGKDSTQSQEEQEEVIISEENLTKENFIASRKIMEKRLKLLGEQDYTIRQNEEDGKIYIELIILLIEGL